jgi:hypothetical protein
LRDGDYCIFHDPRRPHKDPKQRVPEVKQGSGHAPRPALNWNRIEITDRAGLLTFINEIVNQIASGAMSPKVARVLAPHIANMVKLLERNEPEGPTAETSQGERDALSVVLDVLDDHPVAKADLIKRMEQVSP